MSYLGIDVGNASPKNPIIALSLRRISAEQKHNINAYSCNTGDWFGDSMGCPDYDVHDSGSLKRIM